MSPAIPGGFDMKRLEPHQMLMNDMMIGYIEKVRREPEQFILDRHCNERLLNLTPKAAVSSDNTVMYKDKSAFPSFGNAFLMGMEFDFLMLDACIISFVNRCTMQGSNVVNPTLMGVLVAYLANVGL